MTSRLTAAHCLAVVWWKVDESWHQWHKLPTETALSSFVLIDHLCSLQNAVWRSVALSQSSWIVCGCVRSFCWEKHRSYSDRFQVLVVDEEVADVDRFVFVHVDVCPL